MTDRAGDRLTVEVVAKKSAGGSLRRVLNVFGWLTGDQTITGLEDEILVKDRATDAIVYRETIDEGPAVAGTLQRFQDHLEQLDLAAFCAEYGIENYPPR